MQGATISELRVEWELALQAQRKSPATIATYTTAVIQFGQFLDDDPPVDQVDRRHIRAFIAHLLVTRSPATAKARHGGLQAFFRWVVREGELELSPVDGVSPPNVPEPETPVVPDDALRRLLRVCGGRTFWDRRDAAVITLMADSGMRRAEVARLAVADIDWDMRVAHVLGKGSRRRAAPFGGTTTLALRRYLRERSKRPQADLPHLWLGKRGPFGGTGIQQMLRRRSEQAGIGHVHPHMLRHTFASAFLEDGGQEGDLMRLAGWRSRAMLDRYGRAAAERRALGNYNSPMDRLDRG